MAARFRQCLALAALSAACLLGTACTGPWRTIVVNNVFVLGDVHPGDTRELQAIYAREQHRLFLIDRRLIYTSLTAPDSFHWTSSDTTVATVDAAGVVLGRRPGRFAVVVETQGVRSTPSYYDILPPADTTR